MIDIFQSDLRPMEYWHLRAERKLQQWEVGEAEGFATGFSDLDRIVRLRPSELIIVAGQSSMGKTSLGMQMVEHMADQIQTSGDNGCIAVFSAEMSGESLFMRMASALCGVNAHQLAMGKGTPEMIRDMRCAMERIRSRPIWIDDCSGPTTSQMLKQLSELNETVPVRGMLFDFMELSGDEARSEEQRVGGIAQNLKGIAKTLHIPVIALSQVNDESEKRANKMPSMNDLRYSRKITHLADVVMLLTRWDYYLDRGLVSHEQLDGMGVPEAEREGVASVVVGKHRNGPTGTRNLAFIKEQSKFANLQVVRHDLNAHDIYADHRNAVQPQGEGLS